MAVDITLRCSVASKWGSDFDLYLYASLNERLTRFERELEVLRKELAIAQSQSQNLRSQSDLSSPTPSMPNSPQMAPERNASPPDTDADAKEHLVTGSDVISLDSDSHSGSPTPSVDGGLQLFEEARKNQ